MDSSWLPWIGYFSPFIIIGCGALWAGGRVVERLDQASKDLKSYVESNNAVVALLSSMVQQNREETAKIKGKLGMN